MTQIPPGVKGPQMRKRRVRGPKLLTAVPAKSKFAQGGHVKAPRHSKHEPHKGYTALPPNVGD